jgi:hypothetical protein
VTTHMKLSAAFLMLLTGCGPALILPPFDQDGAPTSVDAAEVAHPDAAPDTAFSEVEVADASVDVSVPEVAVPVDAGSPDAPDVVEVDTGSGDAGADVVEAALPDAGPRDTGADVVDAPDVTDSPDASDVQDVTDVVDVPVIPMDIGPPPCLPGQDRCGGSVCLNLSADTANCGGCGNACPARPHAPATCSGGSCALVCDPGTLNCDGNLTNGCETLPSVDANNCGGCGTVCQSFPHTAPSLCVGGVCSFGCGAGYANCDGLVANGCEISTATDPSNCGACGRACGAGQTCAGGTCLCPSGQAPCGGACPNLATDVDNCGACGRACAPGQGCCSGACQNLLADRFNCGTCGTRCPSPTTCNSGSCGCTGGRIVCGSACVDASSDRNNCGWCGRVCPGTAARCVSSHCTA